VRKKLDEHQRQLLLEEQKR